MIQFILLNRNIYCTCEGNIYFKHSFTNELPMYKKYGNRVVFCESKTNLKITLKCDYAKDKDPVVMDIFFAFNKNKIKNSIYEYLYQYANRTKEFGKPFSKEFFHVTDLDTFVDKMEKTIMNSKEVKNRKKYRIHTLKEARAKVSQDINNGKVPELIGKTIDDVDIYLYECISEELRVASLTYDELEKLLNKNDLGSN